MTLGDFMHQTVLSLDRGLTRVQLLAYESRGSLLTIYFHSLFSDVQESRRDLSDPQQAITVDYFRQCLEYFRNAGYRSVSPPEILAGLDPEKRHLLVTFDDGYFNNQRALPVLEACDASALFFISSDHVLLGKAFWWDVLYRARKSVGRTRAEIYREFAQLNRMTTDRVEDLIRQELGENALRPLGDTDRPFTAQELRRFAQSQRVFLGNHTRNHAVLEAYPPAQVRSQIADAQEAIEQMSGTRPQAIAYPNGSFNPQISQIAGEVGLKLGFTIQPRKSYFPQATRHLLELGRFCVWGTSPLSQQFRYFRSDLALYDRYQRLKNSGKKLLRRQGRRASGKPAADPRQM